ncbi:LytTR family DNA-binding domain-containing protein [Flavobacteriaceae sp. LMIT009]
MRVIIVEDEVAASENLTYILNQIDPSIEIVKILDSVASAVSYFKSGVDADLTFMDIHLADGLSFEIFEQVDVKTPIIFTTAYDQYAIQAFKVNSVDYLLKPIDEDELSDAINKFKNSTKTAPQLDQLKVILGDLTQGKKSYKTTYLVQKRDELIPLKTDNIAFIYIETGIVKAISDKNNTYIINKKLEDIEAELNPKIFFRANRQFIINKEAIANIKFYFNGKLIVNTNPPAPERIVVSKAKASEIKDWVNS